MTRTHAILCLAGATTSITAAVFAQETRDRTVAGMRKVDALTRESSVPPSCAHGSSYWISRDKIIGALSVVSITSSRHKAKLARSQGGM